MKITNEQGRTMKNTKGEFSAENLCLVPFLKLKRAKFKVQFYK